MSESSPRPEAAGAESAEPGPEETDAGAGDPNEAESGDTLSEEDYALGSTNDPGGAEREEPAGEDYAGSGF